MHLFELPATVPLASCSSASDAMRKKSCCQEHDTQVERVHCGCKCQAAPQKQLQLAFDAFKSLTRYPLLELYSGLASEDCGRSLASILAQSDACPKTTHKSRPCLFLLQERSDSDADAPRPDPRELAELEVGQELHC